MLPHLVRECNKRGSEHEHDQISAVRECNMRGSEHAHGHFQIRAVRECNKRGVHVHVCECDKRVLNPQGTVCRMGALPLASAGTHASGGGPT